MKILVTFDGSTFSEAILAPVVQVAESIDAEIQLLTVVEKQGTPGSWT
jgi:nucleotide-binding universal stress UspA family protein